MEPSLLSLLPPLAAIILALATKSVVPALLLGVWLGATMIADWNPLTGVYSTFNDFIIPSVGDPGNATILIYCAFFGGLIAVLQRSGGAYAVAKAISSKVRSARGAQASTMGFGLLIFFEDYFNALTVGNVMRPLTDRHRVSREKLAYIVDSTSAPICLLGPVSTWVVFVMGLIGAQYAELGITGSTYVAYLGTIPYNFYAIAAIVMVGIVVFSRIEYGPMRAAEHRARTTGQVLGPNASPPSADEITAAEPDEGVVPRVRSIVVPIVVLLVVAPVLFLITGGFPGNDLLTAISESEGGLSILVASFAAGVVALGMGMADRTFTFGGAINAYLDGVKGMSLVYVIHTLAWSIGSVTEEVGTAAYVVGLVEQMGMDQFVFVLVFLVSGFVAFTTGTSYGTFAIMLPIAIPIAASLDLAMAPAIAAVFGGGIFGDHCSPISDTTILSSAGSSCDHIDHVNTQLPYAITAAVVAAVSFLVLGFTGLWWLSAVVGILGIALAAGSANRLWPAPKAAADETARV
ncbi:MAG TPA: Na+/H+ antiporter NhaC family protein [Jiangellaceae bacterium]|nr:Na+/H+ antiporter NhaC family protein [Jiangellaceae bacterium]